MKTNRCELGYLRLEKTEFPILDRGTLCDVKARSQQKVVRRWSHPKDHGWLVDGLQSSTYHLFLDNEKLWVNSWIDNAEKLLLRRSNVESKPREKVWIPGKVFTLPETNIVNVDERRWCSYVLLEKVIGLSRRQVSAAESTFGDISAAWMLDVVNYRIRSSVFHSPAGLQTVRTII